MPIGRNERVASVSYISFVFAFEFDRTIMLENPVNRETRRSMPRTILKLYLAAKALLRWETFRTKSERHRPLRIGSVTATLGILCRVINQIALQYREYYFMGEASST